ncbi:hypothetical protein QJS66_21875 [Kocuria rhizophila]|nr:hypothetical protein QJS66_21875 [Kocuria rhizophila]
MDTFQLIKESAEKARLQGLADGPARELSEKLADGDDDASLSAGAFPGVGTRCSRRSSRPAAVATTPSTQQGRRQAATRPAPTWTRTRAWTRSCTSPHSMPPGRYGCRSSSRVTWSPLQDRRRGTPTSRNQTGVRPGTFPAEPQ